MGFISFISSVNSYANVKTESSVGKDVKDRFANEQNEIQS